MAAPTPKRGTEMALMDCSMIVITTEETNPRSIAIRTATKLGVEPLTEDNEGKKLIVKNVLFAQKPESSVLTGHKLTLTDNVLILEALEILQGGTITKDSETSEITGYTPPVAGVAITPVKFTLDAYSEEYGTGGSKGKYTKISYPNCTGSPVALNSEDDVFQINEYTINSLPPENTAPYTLTFVDALPTVTTI